MGLDLYFFSLLLLLLVGITKTFEGTNEKLMYSNLNYKNLGGHHVNKRSVLQENHADGKEVFGVKSNGVNSELFQKALPQKFKDRQKRAPSNKRSKDRKNEVLLSNNDIEALLEEPDIKNKQNLIKSQNKGKLKKAKMKKDTRKNTKSQRNIKAKKEIRKADSKKGKQLHASLKAKKRKPNTGLKKTKSDSKGKIKTENSKTDSNKLKNSRGGTNVKDRKQKVHSTKLKKSHGRAKKKKIEPKTDSARKKPHSRAHTKERTPKTDSTREKSQGEAKGMRRKPKTDSTKKILGSITKAKKGKLKTDLGKLKKSHSGAKRRNIVKNDKQRRLTSRRTSQRSRLPTTTISSEVKNIIEETKEETRAVHGIRTEIIIPTATFPTEPTAVKIIASAASTTTSEVSVKRQIIVTPIIDNNIIKKQAMIEHDSFEIAKESGKKITIPITTLPRKLSDHPVTPSLETYETKSTPAGGSNLESDTSAKKDASNSDVFYIQRGASSITPCLSELEESESQIVDPRFKWTNSLGEDLTDARFKMLEGGILEVQDAQPRDSGVYTCMAKGETETGQAVRQQFNHSLTVFVPPKYEYAISFKYEVEDCDKDLTALKENKVTQSLCPERPCVFSLRVSCHAVRGKKGSLKMGHEIWIKVTQVLEPSFNVPKCSPGCVRKKVISNLNKKYQRVEAHATKERLGSQEDFAFQTDSLKKRLVTLCPAGYGKRQANACVACDPGSYRNRGNETCRQCPMGQFQPEYAMQHCHLCPKGTTTAAEGTRDEQQCFQNNGFQLGFQTIKSTVNTITVISIVVAIITLVLLIACLIRFCCSPRDREKSSKCSMDEAENKHLLAPDLIDLDSPEAPIPQKQIPVPAPRRMSEFVKRQTSSHTGSRILSRKSLMTSDSTGRSHASRSGKSLTHTEVAARSRPSRPVSRPRPHAAISGTLSDASYGRLQKSRSRSLTASESNISYTAGPARPNTSREGYKQRSGSLRQKRSTSFAGSQAHMAEKSASQSFSDGSVMVEPNESLGRSGSRGIPNTNASSPAQNGHSIRGQSEKDEQNLSRNRLKQQASVVATPSRPSRARQPLIIRSSTVERMVSKGNQRNILDSQGNSTVTAVPHPYENIQGEELRNASPDHAPVPPVVMSNVTQHVVSSPARLPGSPHGSQAEANLSPGGQTRVIRSALDIRGDASPSAQKVSPSPSTRRSLSLRQSKKKTPPTSRTQWYVPEIVEKASEASYYSPPSSSHVQGSERRHSADDGSSTYDGETGSEDSFSDYEKVEFAYIPNQVPASPTMSAHGQPRKMSLPETRHQTNTVISSSQLPTDTVISGSQSLVDPIAFQEAFLERAQQGSSGVMRSHAGIPPAPMLPPGSSVLVNMGPPQPPLSSSFRPPDSNDGSARLINMAALPAPPPVLGPSVPPVPTPPAILPPAATSDTSHLPPAGPPVHFFGSSSSQPIAPGSPPFGSLSGGLASPGIPPNPPHAPPFGPLSYFNPPGPPQPPAVAPPPPSFPAGPPQPPPVGPPVRALGSLEPPDAPPTVTEQSDRQALLANIRALRTSDSANQFL